jgi:hypothetical protein
VNPPQPKQLSKLIQELRLEMRRARARGELYEIARTYIEQPQEILDWAKSDRRWSFTLAEVMAGGGHHPNDLAAGLVLAIADELEDESEILADTSETIAIAAIESN